MYLKNIMSFKKAKKAAAAMMCAAMIFAGFPAVKADAVTVIENSGTTARPYRDLTASEIVEEMGAGWNLGNTMDGHTGFTPSETAWQSVETTQQLIDAVHDYGFNTVRVPVTWGTKIDDANGYAIDEAWISRVQDIVDYCISQDMYVIINIHHDGAEQTGWLRIASENPDAVEEKFAAVWKQIAERFKDYDEHLIFESMNEVTGDDGSLEGIISDMNMIKRLNQTFVNTVRATGSNNAVRWLSVPGRYTNISITTDDRYGFEMPVDTVENKLFLSVHYYDWQFGIMETMGRTTFSSKNVSDLDAEFDRLTEKFISKGIPVIVGEYGCVNKNNITEREYHLEAVNRICEKHDLIVSVLWDQGWYDRTREPADYSFTVIDRETFELVDPEVVYAIMRGKFVDGADDYSDITKGTEVIPITNATISEEDITLTVGDTKKLTYTLEPANTNDVLLWSTSDRSVATVYNGNIIARGAGTAAITVRSQSGSYEKEILIKVAAVTDRKAATVIECADELTLEKGTYEYLNAVCDGDAYVSYKSSDSSVATVSSIGKVVAKEYGTAYIIVTASTGITKTVKVTVEEKKASQDLVLALNVYYNDKNIEYYSNEYGSPVTVTGEGQYTVVFDCETDLSDEAKAAGAKDLSNLTAIYIKDYNVTTAQAKKTPLASCDIMYDKIVVDGKELTITQTEPKSALKPSKVLDTNDPLNAWDGSMVEEVEVNKTDHSLCIAGIESPKRIEVTFTLSNMTAAAADGSAKTTDITDIIFADESVSFKNIGEVKIIELDVVPQDAAGTVTFVSKDTAIAAVTTSYNAAEGKVYAMVVSNGEGEVDITAYAGAKELTFTARTVLPTPTPEPTATSAPEPTKAPELTPTPEPTTSELKEDEAVKDTHAEAEEDDEDGISLGAGIAITVVVIVIIAAVFIFAVKKNNKSASKASDNSEEAADSNTQDKKED